MPIFQLFYVSQANRNFDPAHIPNILAKAHSFNPTQGLSGVLMFRGGTFIQLLEGEEEKVRSLYRKIGTDPRHSNLLTIFERHTDERIFSDWSMAYKEIGTLDLRLINEILSWRALIGQEPVDEMKIMEFLYRFKTVELIQ